MTVVSEYDFVPACVTMDGFERRVRESGRGRKVSLAVEQPGSGVVSRIDTVLFAPVRGRDAENLHHLERLLKTLLWMRGGAIVYLAGAPELLEPLKSLYSISGERAFDRETMLRVFSVPELEFHAVDFDAMPATRFLRQGAGGGDAGCRVGLDLGGSSIKAVAIRDGHIVDDFKSPWNPCFEADPEYHKRHILNVINRAALSLPKLEAVGVSSAGIFIDNRCRISSLFRGVSAEAFAAKVEPLFVNLGHELGVPLEAVNDGDAAALAGASTGAHHGVLGLSFGSSLAGGYVLPDGTLTGFINEFAFIPIDCATNGAPVDEWSGDGGCAVQYLTKQAVERLMREGERKPDLFDGIGRALGHTIAWLHRFYEFDVCLMLGGVLIDEAEHRVPTMARRVLEKEYPELSAHLQFRAADDTLKRNGQAVAAARLPRIQ